ncbi:TolC family protein [Pedobacter sp. SYSU D00535]|uniref:TolC family protein n=1 Tax=Pedobacter sp. SYSU D00535 TaxID=2810308 RepID=UPI001A9718D6|nr:TolC family protein [Pedobacter sp. SYSU D00535]
MKYKYNALIIVFFLVISTRSFSQESIMEDISYPFLERLVETAKENYPTIKGLDSRIKSAEYGVVRAKLGWLAPLSVSYVYQPNAVLNIVEPSLFSGIQIGFTLNIGSIIQNPWNVKQAKAETKTLQFEKEAYLLNIEAQVKTRYYQYVQKMATLKLRSRGMLDAENMLGGMKFKYEKSEITFGDYSQALLAFYEQNQTKLQAENEMLVAKASLEELLGKKLEEVK